MKLIIFYILITISIYSESFKIDYAFPFDLNRNDFMLSIRTDDPLQTIEILKGVSNKKFKITINNINSEIYPGSAFQEKTDIVEVIFNSYRKVNTGNAEVKLLLLEENKETLLDSFEIKIPENYSEDKQPIILGLSPLGGKIGDSVTIQGKNFGNDLDDIDIYFFDRDFERPTDLEPTEEQPLEYMQMRAKANPFSLNATLDGVQHVSFAIPTTPYIRDLAENVIFRKSIQLKVYVHGRPSAFTKVTILPNTWNLKVIALALLVTILGLGLIALMLGKWNFLPYVLIDKSTNTYSLSKFQAFVWTVVLTGSYFYVAIAFGILLQNGKIPDFNPSLVGLMTISYTGFITSHFLNKRKPKNEVFHNPPKLSDLFMENGVINITRLQLLVFTTLSVIVYLYNLYLSNVLNGLPDIPPTLHGLLISSQSGYIGGIIFGEKIAVNRITPQIVLLSEKSTEFTLIGSGFVNGMKAMIEGSEHDPVEVVFVSNSVISFTLPVESKAGKKNLILIPPTGSTSLISEAIEYKEG